MTDKATRRELARAYKETRRTMGVYRVRKRDGSFELLGSSADVGARLNRHRAQLRMHMHPNRQLQAAWDSAGQEEFVFEVLLGDDQTYDWGLNIRRCAVCHAYARHDAMDLVPYMCASDDVESDRGGQGLRRTGTIGLGAHQCDFRYKAGGDPLRLADQYPDRIRTTTEGRSGR